MPNEVLCGQMVIPVRLRKRERASYVAAQSLPERAVPTLDMRRLARLFAHRLMPTRLKDFRISRPEIAVACAAAVTLRNAFEQAATTPLAAISDDVGHNLTCPATKCHPEPSFLLPSIDETVHLIEFEHIVRSAGCDCIAEGRQRRGQMAQHQQHGLKREVEDATDAAQGEPFSEGFFEHILKLGGASSGHEHACFSAVVTEAALITVSGVSVFDDIDRAAVGTPVRDAGCNHGSGIW